ncbi:MAG TPA: signal peptidase II [Rhodospirillales bacterium]|nr:signal peptidase II [Rhodospirillales bacterium]
MAPLRFRWPAGLLVVAAVLAVDQGVKWLVLETFYPGEVRPVLPFFNLVLVFNRGVSFGLFSGSRFETAWLLSGLAIAIVLGLLYWLRSEKRPLARFAIWLVIGGALGNVVDRLRYGMVVDFLDFYIKSYHWPAFNLADVAVVCGASALIWESFVESRAQRGETGERT